MLVLVYNENNNKIERYNLQLGSRMPYIKNKFLAVKEFRGSSKTQILWTTKKTMEAFNVTRERWREPIYVGYAFKRIFEGGHSNQSQHYAEVCFDIAQNLSVKKRRDLYNLCQKLNIWSYVEPINLTPRWLHIDKRDKKSACSAGYPEIKINSRGVYVLVLQDSLMRLGYNTGGLDGIFGTKTLNSVRSFQKKYEINENDIVKCKTWKKLVSLVVGKGKSSTVAYY